MSKYAHEIRDPIHTFIHLDSDERAIVDSSPLQRLRHIHQLALSYLVYPGATHRRFEHSLGVMELAGRVFDVITKAENIRDESVRDLVRPHDSLRLLHWRRTLRIAALCHDVGHLPFSHAAEQELLPNGWDHERLTVKIIESLEGLLAKLEPPVRWLDIAKLAVGPKRCEKYAKAGDLPSNAVPFTDWESILAEVIIGDAFGVDRMDYLLRDSYHAGVVYGKFDHYRLIDTLRILPKAYEQESKEPALGVEEGGLHSAEALLLARFFMYTQVYFHPVRRIYDVHLKDFLSEWLKGRYLGDRFPTSVNEHLALTDNEVTAAVLQAARDGQCAGHEAARRIVERDHFHLVYQWNHDDAKTNAAATDAIHAAARDKFKAENVRRDSYPAKSIGVVFPVWTKDERVTSSFGLSEVLQRIPAAKFDLVFVRGGLEKEAREWLKRERTAIITAKAREETDGTARA